MTTDGCPESLEDDLEPGEDVLGPILGLDRLDCLIPIYRMDNGTCWSCRVDNGTCIAWITVLVGTSAVGPPLA